MSSGHHHGKTTRRRRDDDNDQTTTNNNTENANNNQALCDRLRNLFLQTNNTNSSTSTEEALAVFTNNQNRTTTSSIPSGWIELNVGGTPIITMSSTFLDNIPSKIPHNSDLAHLALDNFSTLPKDSQGRPFFDAEPKIFRHVLNYLRGYPISCVGVEASLVAEFADNFCLENLKIALGHKCRYTNDALPRLVHGAGVSVDGMIYSSGSSIVHTAAPLPSRRYGGHRIVYKFDRLNPKASFEIGLASKELLDRFGGGPGSTQNHLAVFDRELDAQNVGKNSEAHKAQQQASLGGDKSLCGKKHSVMINEAGIVFSCHRSRPRVHNNSTGGGEKEDQEDAAASSESYDQSDEKTSNNQNKQVEDKYFETTGIVRRTMVDNKFSDGGNGMMLQEMASKDKINRMQDMLPASYTNELLPLLMDNRTVFREGDMVEICVNYLKDPFVPSKGNNSQSKGDDYYKSLRGPKQAASETAASLARQGLQQFLEQENENDKKNDALLDDTAVTSTIRDQHLNYSDDIEADKKEWEEFQYDQLNKQNSNTTNNNTNKIDSKDVNNIPKGLMITISRLRINTAPKNVAPTFAPSLRDDGFEPSPNFSFFDTRLSAVKLFNAVYTNKEFVHDAELFPVMVTKAAVKDEAAAISIEYAAHCYPEDVEVSGEFKIENGRQRQHHARKDQSNLNNDNNNNDDGDFIDQNPELFQGPLHRKEMEELEKKAFLATSKYGGGGSTTIDGSTTNNNNDNTVVIARPDMNTSATLSTEKQLLSVITQDPGGNRILMIPRCVRWEDVVLSRDYKKELQEYRLTAMSKFNEKNKLRPRLTAPGEVEPSTSARGFRSL